MADIAQSPSAPIQPPPLQRPNLSPFYYGLVVIGSIAVILALYNLIIVGWCTHHRRQQLRQRPNNLSFRYPNSPSFENSSSALVPTFKFRKEDTCEQAYGNECSVCLSVFEEGEDVRQLPRCKHSFHASCIDMWLYSHSDCPLCRAIVEPPVSHQIVIPEQNSAEVFLESGSSV